MADLQCQLQQAVDANREVFNNRAEDKRIKNQIGQSRSATPGTVQAKRSIAGDQNARNDQATPQRKQADQSRDVQAITVSQEAALALGKKKLGVARFNALKKEVAARRDVDGLLEPIYILQYGDDTPSDYNTVRGSKPDQLLFIFRGTSLLTVIEPLGTAPFGNGYESWSDNVYENSVARIEASGGVVTVQPNRRVNPQSWTSAKVNGFLIVDQKLYITYCRGVALQDTYSSNIGWRIPSEPLFSTVFVAAPAFLTDQFSGYSFVYYDFVTYEVDLISGGISAASSPFLQYSIKSDSTAFRTQTGITNIALATLSTPVFWIEHTYSRVSSQKQPAEALAETLSESHPAQIYGPGFWRNKLPFVLPTISTSGGVYPRLTPFNELVFDNISGLALQPSLYVDEIKRFPSGSYQSANISEGLKVFSDQSGVGELGSLSLDLLTEDDLRLAFGRYSSSFSDYSPGSVEDFEGAFYTENLTDQAIQLLSAAPDPPGSISTAVVTGTPAATDGRSVYFAAAPEDQDVIDNLFAAFSADSYFVGYLIAPEDS